MSAPTPGPWTVGKMPRGDGHEIYMVQGRRAAHVAIVYEEVDARQIAAAPELLDALRYAETTLIAAFDYSPAGAISGGRIEISGTLSIIRTAVAKAEGK